LVTLTDRGRTVMTEMEEQRSQIAAELVADLDPAELETFRQGLDRVAGRLQALIQAGTEQRKQSA
jgi:DNA-binding MarR family transcriptional regulator